MEATLDNLQFIDQVKWRRTDVSTAAVTSLDNDGLLTLTLTEITKANHEGVYEVYRTQRDLRTWHPIIYLYVRGRLHFQTDLKIFEMFILKIHSSSK